MNDSLADILKRLSSRSVLGRKAAIRSLKAHLGSGGMAPLLLHYVSVHDPSYTVRNIARQAFYSVGSPPEQAVWEKHFVFHSE